MSTNSCIRNLLKFISLLQKNSLGTNKLYSNCTKPFLGPSINNCYNTRVITLYKKNGKLLEVPYQDNNTSNTSSLFRINDVKDNCCNLLILTKQKDKYISTGNCITLNINCICAIKCLEDVVIDNLCERRYTFE